ncbi:MAG: TIGR01621 family pseudouridine synthase [Idiomarina sp.]
MPIPVLIEHADFFIVDKPAGSHMHSQHGQQSLVQQLSTQLDEPLWPVHRLDAGTSGLLILARSGHAAANFGKLFEQHQLEKFYVAVAAGKPKKKQGWVRGDMAKARNGNWKLSKSTNNPACTQFFSYALPNAPGYRGYLLRPLTGRTHQLRVALKSIGAPIVGDTRYGGATDSNKTERLHLHAYALRFQYQHELIELVRPPEAEEYFAALTPLLEQQEINKPWQLSWPAIAERTKP